MSLTEALGKAANSPQAQMAILEISATTLLELEPLHAKAVEQEQAIDGAKKDLLTALSGLTVAQATPVITEFVENVKDSDLVDKILSLLTQKVESTVTTTDRLVEILALSKLYDDIGERGKSKSLDEAVTLQLSEDGIDPAVTFERIAAITNHYASSSSTEAFQLSSQQMDAIDGVIEQQANKFIDQGTPNYAVAELVHNAVYHIEDDETAVKLWAKLNPLRAPEKRLEELDGLYSDMKQDMFPDDKITSPMFANKADTFGELEGLVNKMGMANLFGIKIEGPGQQLGLDLK